MAVEIVWLDQAKDDLRDPWTSLQMKILWRLQTMSLA
jgi:hypothetical protein